ncbi:MAG: hypothetical protein V3U79_00545 [Dehalococcoidia bacterium]
MYKNRSTDSEDYQAQILEAHRKLELAYSDVEVERSKLKRWLKRARELYEWRDYTKEEYQVRRDSINRGLEALPHSNNGVDHLDKLAHFLADVPMAWEAATPEQRNKLARCIFDQLWLKDKTVVAVKPRPELEPFFRLNYETFYNENIEGPGSRTKEVSPE